MTSKISNIKSQFADNDWTLFLDRDGVINKRLVDDYVKSVDEFEFLPGVLDAIAVFAKIFRHIFIVTNQQAIGKGLMSDADLVEIHSNMISQIVSNGGRIDKVYYCPDLAASNSPNRKPMIGMALQAKNDFPDVNFAKSIMIGDSKSDMVFGKNAGMTTVFITTDLPESPVKVDFTYSSLQEVGWGLG